MRSLNKLQVIGHLGSDPELSYTGSGTAVANLSVATDAPMGDETEWHNVTCWGDLAEIVSEHLSKGRRVYVEGPLQTRKWEDADGNTRHTTELHADEVIFLGSTGEGGQTSNGKAQTQAAGGDGEPHGRDVDRSDPPEQETFEPDDSLPF